ncbi:leucine-rich repeat and fibronectin type-III domain-containing protein 5-like [Branchiostoma floridae]|uniref:Leucine-rich repeat and fibronectin type-III domain-containing protein 5-like n=1 Tax=Branchiostoma floridae TaxID=7739 RepID=A0A9J7M190_BRAFL|nr:leucine-rich repeat and fibronectin type-III domain-containing protein 5-like [Branchiostoma floridae]
MANKLATLLVLLIIILREPGQTQQCDSSCPSVCNCVGRGFRLVPADLPRTITSLKLHHNSITNLRRIGFSLYSKLKELNVNHNKISKVHKQAFSGQLQKLYLSNNKITYIQPGAFSLLGWLQELNLNGNKITNIDPGTFSCLPGILSCLSNLRSLNLGNNKITKIPLGTFLNLTSLSSLGLYSNNLTTVLPGTFTNKRRLKHLSLHNNQITDFKTGTFSDLPRLHFLELSSNQLRDIQPGALSNLTNLKTLRLDENPWNCDCRMVGVKKTFKFNNKITCQEPSNLHGRKLDEIDPNNLICTKPKIVSFENIKGNRLVSGEILHLVCEASGIPKPDITVTIPSGLKATVESSVRVTVGVNGAITVTNVTAADAGKYICTARNLVGFAYVNLFVVVEIPTSVIPVVSTGLVETSDVIASTSASHTDGMMFKRLTTSDRLFVEVKTITSVMSGISTSAVQSDGMVSQKPTIVKFKVSNSTIAQGETLYLVCEASGRPPPNILVTLPSGLIASAESGGRVTVGVNGTITITNVTAADAGLYVCIATNPEGSASATVFVDVQTAIHDSTLPPLGYSEGDARKFPLPPAIGLATVGGVIMISVALVFALWRAQRKKKAQATSAPTIDPPTDDMDSTSLNSSGGQGRSEITSSTTGTEQADTPENVYEDPESLIAVAGPPLGAVGSKEESVVCASKAASAQKPMTVHELVNIVYGEDQAGPLRGPNTHVKETDHEASLVTENTVKYETVLYASAQVIYGHEDDKAQSVASQSIYKADNE